MAPVSPIVIALTTVPASAATIPSKTAANLTRRNSPWSEATSPEPMGDSAVWCQ
jgi:hypothetical protein